VHPLLLEEVPHVVGEAGKAEEARLLVEERVDLREGKALLVVQEVEDGRVDVLTDSPRRMAQAEQPLPRWRVTTFVSS
jgi:predicted methyltransferase